MALRTLSFSNGRSVPLPDRQFKHQPSADCSETALCRDRRHIWRVINALPNQAIHLTRKRTRASDGTAFGDNGMKMELSAALLGVLLLSVPLGGGLFTLWLGVSVHRDAGTWSLESRTLTMIGAVLLLIALLAAFMAYGVWQT